MIRDILKKLAARQELDAGEIQAFVSLVSKGSLSKATIAAFLMGLSSKGVKAPEVLAIVQAMQAEAVAVRPVIHGELLDTCGTGGGLHTFNISTATAIVCASAGIFVAKHGSRSLSASAGSADVLEALGVVLDLPPPSLARMIEEIGIAFLHAPQFHPVMGQIVPIEQSLGIKTIFYSLVGPLINPANARRHLLGVYRHDWLPLAAEVLKQRDFRHAMVVHGVDQLDEMSVLGTTQVYEVKQGAVETYEITPEQFGLVRCSYDDIRSLGSAENARLIRAVLAGKVQGGARNAILLNAAAGLVLGGAAPSLKEGVRLAGELIDEGRALHKLDQLVQASNDFAARTVAHLPSRDAARAHVDPVWSGLLSSSNDALVLLSPDGNVTQANDKAREQLGVGAGRIVGQPYARLLGSELARVRLHRIAEVLESGQPGSWEDSAGTSIYKVSAVPIEGGTAFVIVSHDITQHRKLERSEQDKRARLQTLIETLPDVIWLVDEQGRMLNCNHRFESLAGQAEPLMKGRPLSECLPDATQDMATGVPMVLGGGAPVIDRCWVDAPGMGGPTYFEVIHSPFIVGGELKGVMSIARDLTVLQRNQEELQRQKDALRTIVYTDGLTGLPTRHALGERMRELTGKGAGFSMISILLRHVSQLIGSFGIRTTERLIVEAAAAIKRSVPVDAQLFRRAEVSFDLILPDITDAAQLAAVSERLIEQLSRPVHAGDVSIFVSVSLGVATFPRHGPDTEQLVQNAIAALHEAKQVDGAAWRIFDPSMLEKARNLQWLDHSLRVALEQQQFHLHYQPKVNLTNGELTGVEALIRWAHPERGAMRPDEFVPRAEANGLIIPLGRWVIAEAARQAQRWLLRGKPVRVALNLSARQILDEQLLTELREAQAVAQGLLDIELTESTLMGSPTKMAELLHECRHMGYRIYLDDFGTGYSSLSVLAKLPLTSIKIDKVFIQDIGTPGNAEALLRSMVLLANELNLAIVAEGIETRQQADLARTLGVQEGQGWLYAKAMPPDELEMRWATATASSHAHRPSD